MARGILPQWLKNFAPSLNEQATLTNQFEEEYYGLTIGEVVDTNDPQQMGRLRVFCPTLGDRAGTIEEIEDIPWALPVFPFFGASNDIPRGPELSESDGTVAYGFWSVPKEGAHVIVALLDGRPENRLWFGSVPPQFKPHTMPHGRYNYTDVGSPEGPMTSADTPIEPLYSSQTAAFTSRQGNFEWRTRGADYTVAAIRANLTIETTSSPDDIGASFTEEDGNEIEHTQGYTENYSLPEFGSIETDGIKYDPRVYSWTTPGFHSIAMDDNEQNCRIRLRTTTGHQIILDDTNERIYISTTEGNNWVELDSNGNIDVFSSRRISMHAYSDINFTTKGSFRVHAKEGIHFYTDDEIRAHAKKDIHVKAEDSLRIKGENNVLIETQSAHIKSESVAVEGASSVDINSTNGVLRIGANSDVHVKAGGALFEQAGSDINILAGGSILNTGEAIHLNGLPAGSATNPLQANVANEYESFWTNRVPDHEGWGRIMNINTDNNQNNTHDDLEFEYTDDRVGYFELGEEIKRGTFWHR